MVWESGISSMGVFSGDWAEEVSISMWSVDGVFGGFSSGSLSEKDGAGTPFRVEFLSDAAMCGLGLGRGQTTTCMQM